MVYSEFKNYLNSIMPGRETANLPPDTVLRTQIFRALKRIAKETVPLKLVVNDNSQNTVIRKLDNDTFIRFPLEVYRDDDDIDIDDELIDAVAAHVASEIEPQRKGHFLQQYEREILLNNTRLIETDLDYFSNVSTRNVSWV